MSLLFLACGAKALYGAAEAEPNKDQKPAAPEAEPNKDQKPATAGNEEITIVINDDPINGWAVLPADEKGFKFKVKDTGDVVDFPWSVLSEFEKKRVQKIYRIQIDEEKNRVVSGRKVSGLKIKLDSGKEWIGMLIPERSKDGMTAIKTKDVPYMAISDRQIVSREEIELDEYDVYTPREIYDQYLLEHPPGKDDAAAHLEAAHKAATLGLFRAALDELNIAEIIDSRTAERTKDERGTFMQKFMEEEGDKLYGQLMRDFRAQDFWAAKDDADKFLRQFPNHTNRTRVEGMSQDIEKGMQVQLEQKVVQMCYVVSGTLLEKRCYSKIKVDLKGNKVPSIPGKQVITKAGDNFIGEIVVPDSANNQGDDKAPDQSQNGQNGQKSPAERVEATNVTAPDANGDIVMKIFDSRLNQMSNTTLTIRAADVMTVQDIDLAVGAKEVTPSFDELKTYVTDLSSDDGLKKQMIVYIAKLLKNVPEDHIREIFDKRLEKTATYEGHGRVQISKNWAVMHDAFYGKGSWLRDGAKPLPSPFSQLQPRVNGLNWWQRVNNQVQQQQNQVNLQDSTPEMTDDPEIWWKFQDLPTHVAILKAIMAEKLFSAEPPISVPCKQCNHKGTISVQGPDGYIDIRCPACRGLGEFYKIRYK
jgi:hypothetical protein